MINEVKRNYGAIKILIWLSIVAVGSYVLSIAWSFILSFIDLLMVLITSWLLGFVMDPVVSYIQKWTKLSKISSALVAYFLVSLVLVTIGVIYIPLVSTQIPHLLDIVFKYLDSAPKFMTDFNNALVSQLSSTVNLIPSIAQFLFSTFVVLVLSFYLVVDHERFTSEVLNLLPFELKETYQYVERVINNTFVIFFRVQLFYGVVAAVTTWLIFVVLRINYGVSVAFVSGIFTLFPLIGPLFALVIPVLVALSVGSWQALVVAIYLFVVQQISFNVVGPRLLGKELKIHPGIVLFSFLVGLKFGGALGAFFAIPILGISILMIRRFGNKVWKLGVVNKVKEIENEQKA